MPLISGKLCEEKAGARKVKVGSIVVFRVAANLTSIGAQDLLASPIEAFIYDLPRLKLVALQVPLVFLD